MLFSLWMIKMFYFYVLLWGMVSFLCFLCLWIELGGANQALMVYLLTCLEVLHLFETLNFWNIISFSLTSSLVFLSYWLFLARFSLGLCPQTSLLSIYSLFQHSFVPLISLPYMSRWLCHLLFLALFFHSPNLYIQRSNKYFFLDVSKITKTHISKDKLIILNTFCNQLLFLSLEPTP